MCDDVAFRDHLRAHPGDLRAYAELKLALSGREGQEYHDEKASFVTELERRIGALTVVSLDKAADPS